MDETLLKKNGKTICWKNLSMDDVEEVEKLMIEYCRSEPLHAALNSSELEAMVIEKSKEVLAENISIGAYDVDDKKHLCALQLISVYGMTSNLPQDLQKAREYFSTGFSVLFRYGYETVKDFQNVLQNQKFLLHLYASTSSSYRRMGITTKLQKKMEEICEKQKLRYIVGVYTSAFTQRSSKNLGYKTIKEINYAEYVDPLTNEKPFKDVEVPPSAIGMYFDLEQ